MAGSFARDYAMRGEMAATLDGRMLAVRVETLADHGAFNADRPAESLPGGFFHVFHRSMTSRAAYCHSSAASHTNKAPACRLRVLVRIAEAVYVVDGLVDPGWRRAGARPPRSCLPSDT